jgi:hypothetical protein
VPRRGWPRARAERDWLVGRLAAAAGFSSRTQSFPGQGKRARAIRRAIVRIIQADSVIGEHLRRTVHVGLRCSYWSG